MLVFYLPSAACIALLVIWKWQRGFGISWGWEQRCCAQQPEDKYTATAVCVTLPLKGVLPVAKPECSSEEQAVQCSASRSEGHNPNELVS